MNLRIEKISHFIKKLTKEQRKIISVGLVVLIFLLFFLIFIYHPQSRKFAKIKNELAQTENQIAEIYRLTQGKDLAGAVRDLKIELIQTTSNLPIEDEVVISNLLENAKKLKIEVKNITPSAKIRLENKIPGYIVEELPILMNLTCEFRVLGDYLNILRNKLPVLICIKKLDIQGKGQINLDISLQILAYLAKEK